MNRSWRACLVCNARCRGQTSSPDTARDAVHKSAILPLLMFRILFVRPSTVSSRWPPEIRLRLLPTTTMKCLIRPAISPRQLQAPSLTFQLLARRVRARTGSQSSPTASYRSIREATSPPTLAQALAALIVHQVRAHRSRLF
jgi:hypothetical protein